MFEGSPGLEADTEAEKIWAERIGIDPARAVAIPNGVAVSRFRPDAPAERDALRDRLALPAGPVLIYVGRLVAEKRVDRLIAAFRSVREAHPDAEGNIRDHAPLEQLVVLTNLESLNSVLIRQGLPQPERLNTLNDIAITQMQTLLNASSMKRLK